MQHRGEIVKKAIDESGYKKAELARQLRVERKTLYNYFDRADLAIDTILKIGKLIHHDFSDEINELRQMKPNVAESGSVYIAADTEYWKNKYLRLLEEYNTLLREMKGV
jgi:predicted transcriptional regulator